MMEGEIVEVEHFALLRPRCGGESVLTRFCGTALRGGSVALLALALKKITVIRPKCALLQLIETTCPKVQ